VKILPFGCGDARHISLIFSSSGFTSAVVSIEILTAHPRVYWNDHCTLVSEG
jgi:hypothetical protein